MLHHYVVPALRASFHAAWLATAITAGTVWLYSWDRDNTTASQEDVAASAHIKPGRQLVLADVDFNSGQTHAVIVHSIRCAVNQGAKTLYRALADRSLPEIRTTFVFPEDSLSAQRYLREQFGLDGTVTASATLDSLGVDVTPTVLLLDSRGVVRRVWEGLGSYEQISSVRQAFGLPNTSVDEAPRGIVELGAAEVDALAAREPVVDIRSRDESGVRKSSHVVNIPFDELTVRASAELPKQMPVTVVCSSCRECLADGEQALQSLCMRGFRILTGLGFGQLHIVTLVDEPPEAPVRNAK